MDRRAFLRGISQTAFGFAVVAHAEKSRVPVIGFLNLQSEAEWAPRVTSFERGLAEGGYVVGRDIVVEFRWADGQYERLPALAMELVQQQVAVLVATGGGQPIVAAKAATSTIPIVFTLGSDPVRLGVVDSLNRPGANITGITILGLDLTEKRVGILHELVPKAATIGLLVNPDNPRLAEPEAQVASDAARKIGVQVRVVGARNEVEIDRAFSALSQERVSALLIGSDASFEIRRDQVVSLAARLELPTIYPQRESVSAGGLASYGTNLNAAYRQAGLYVAKILAGAKPAMLPVVQLSSVELVLNSKTAKALALPLSPSLLARADEIIQ